MLASIDQSQARSKRGQLRVKLHRPTEVDAAVEDAERGVAARILGRV